MDNLGLLAPIEAEDADIRLVDGRYYICPWRTRIRVLSSLLSMRESPVGEMADVLVPEADAKRAARELSKLRRRNPSAVPFMMQSAWHVPIRWFVLVKDKERRLVERDDRFHLSYETTVGKARRRLDWALAVVKRTQLEPLQDMLTEVQLWLANFDRHSILELDYAGLSRLFTWDELDDDHSARDVEEAIEALGASEMSRSADLYQAVAGRWAEVRAHGSMN
ncbi:MAG: hypothetical protein WD770_07690 [Actinomycetota bacterium]